VVAIRRMDKCRVRLHCGHQCVWLALNDCGNVTDKTMHAIATTASALESLTVCETGVTKRGIREMSDKVARNVLKYFSVDGKFIDYYQPSYVADYFAESFLFREKYMNLAIALCFGMDL
jgi:hypothetical protein